MSNYDQPLTVQAQIARSQLRRSVYWILIVASAGVMIGRVWSATILQSANDRSRWCTIDRVKHKGDDGKEHSYSSKPTLLPTMLAGEYWAIKNITGADLENQPLYVGRLMLLFSNVIPLIVFLVLLSIVVERYGVTDWGRVFVVACGAFGTFLTTFAVTLNNHIPAAISVMVAVHASLAIWRDGDRKWWRFALAGIFSAFAVANELPALAFFAAVAVALLLKAPLRTLVFFVPAAAIVVAGSFYTNYRAHDSWIPPYAHRQDGAELFQLSGSLAAELNEGKVPDELRTEVDKLPKGQRVRISLGALVSDSRPPDTDPPVWKFWAPERDRVMRRWRILDPASHDRLAIVQLERDDVLRVHASDENWYDYEDSYWTGVTTQRDGDGSSILVPRKSKVDRGENSLGLYAFNTLLGHHGVFSLTPVWLLALAGIVMMIVGGKRRMRGFALMVLALSLVCLGFYILSPVQDRNYGGVSCGMRWMFWFTPMWLLCVLPAVDSMANNRFWKSFGLVLLLVSVMSASYAMQNPWSQSWIYDYWKSLDWQNLLHSEPTV